MTGVSQWQPDEITFVLHSLVANIKRGELKDSFEERFHKKINDNQIRYIKNKYGRDSRFDSVMINFKGHNAADLNSTSLGSHQRTASENDAGTSPIQQTIVQPVQRAIEQTAQQETMENLLGEHVNDFQVMEASPQPGVTGPNTINTVDIMVGQNPLNYAFANSNRFQSINMTNAMGNDLANDQIGNETLTLNADQPRSVAAVGGFDALPYGEAGQLLNNTVNNNSINEMISKGNITQPHSAAVMGGLPTYTYSNNAGRLPSASRLSAYHRNDNGLIMPVDPMLQYYNRNSGHVESYPTQGEYQHHVNGQAQTSVLQSGNALHPYAATEYTGTIETPHVDMWESLDIVTRPQANGHQQLAFWSPEWPTGMQPDLEDPFVGPPNTTMGSEFLPLLLAQRARTPPGTPEPFEGVPLVSYQDGLARTRHVCMRGIPVPRTQNSEADSMEANASGIDQAFEAAPADASHETTSAQEEREALAAFPGLEHQYNSPQQARDPNEVLHPIFEPADVDATVDAALGMQSHEAEVPLPALNSNDPYYWRYSSAAPNEDEYYNPVPYPPFPQVYPDPGEPGYWAPAQPPNPYDTELSNHPQPAARSLWVQLPGSPHDDSEDSFDYDVLADHEYDADANNDSDSSSEAY